MLTWRNQKFKLRNNGEDLDVWDKNSIQLRILAFDFIEGKKQQQQNYDTKKNSRKKFGIVVTKSGMISVIKRKYEERR